jgi:hypothetical protein
MRAAALALLLMASGAADAGTLGGGPELGTAGPWPMYRTRLMPHLEVAVAIVRASTGELADTVTKSEPLRVEAALFANGRSKDQDVRLHCQIQRADPKKMLSDVLWHDICFEGNLADVAEDGTLLAVDYTFTPGPRDLNGTAGVAFTIWDEISDRTTAVLTTYRWTGGAE